MYTLDNLGCQIQLLHRAGKLPTAVHALTLAAACLSVAGSKGTQPGGRRGQQQRKYTPGARWARWVQVLTVAGGEMQLLPGHPVPQACRQYGLHML